MPVTIPWQAYKVSVPPGESGDWRVERFSISPEDADHFNWKERRDARQNGFPFRPVHSGQYTRLVHGRRTTVVMSDTYAEIAENLPAIERARGRCLVNGLGLGVVVGAMLEKREVEHVTVVEASQDVINLVASYYVKRFGERLLVVHGDAFRYNPPRGSYYDVAWHDIWTNIDDRNLSGIRRLHAKYRKRCGWQGSWGYRYCLNLSRR